MKKALLLCLLFPLVVFSQSSIPSPEQVFGFKMGSDRKLIDWTQIVSYFKSVDEKSDRVIVQELGKTTLGKPFILAIISSEENIKNLDRYKSIQQQLAKPYSLEPETASKLIAEGKTIVLVTLNIHSTEIASTQESVELVHEFATSNSAQVKKILDNVIFLLIPSLNPDGQQMVSDWYRKTVGTPAEGTAPPQLYHHYAGHDNNRDWFMYNLVESQHTAKVLYHEWFPEIEYDQHQMGSNGPRIFVPPYADPVNPNISPLLSAQTNLLGKYMASDLHKAGLKGIATGTTFNAFFEGTMSKTPLWHNRIGILSEMASVQIATPIFFPKGSVSGAGIDLPENKTQTNYLDPWEGGWWRLRDIVEYEKTATYSLLDFAATLKENIKTNFYNLNREAIAKGNIDAPYGYVFPIDQHDPNAAATLVNKLIISGVEARLTTDVVLIGNRKIPAGSFYISLAQPARAYIKDLIEVQKYPNLKQFPGGPPRPPYDVTAWTMPMQMGVDVIELKEPAIIPSQTINRASIAGGVDARSSQYYALERRYTNSYGLINAILKHHVPVLEMTQAQTIANQVLPAGTFVISLNSSAPNNKIEPLALEKLAQEWQVPLIGINNLSTKELREVIMARIGIYQPWITSMDEGWTRYMLDQFQIGYKSLHNEDINAKGVTLRKDYDVILLPDMSANAIVDGRDRGESERPSEEEPILGTPERPKEFRGGIGKEGTEAIKEFVKSGGTLITLGASSNFAIEKLRLPAVNELRGVASKDFYSPGSIFEVAVNTSEPLAYGMEDHAYIYYINNPAFRLLPYNKESKIIASYGDESPLRSGWLLGGERLLNKIALAEIPVGSGRVIMYGFRVQHRAQTHGTYKLLLNALFVGRK